SSFPIASDPDRQLRVLLAEPIDEAEDLLHLVADDVPAEIESRAIDPFAMSAVGHGDARVAGPGVLAVDEDGDDDLAAVLGQVSRPLLFRRQTGSEADEHFR